VVMRVSPIPSRSCPLNRPRNRARIRRIARIDSAMPRHIWRSGGDLRRCLYEILEHGTIGNRTGLIVGRLIVLLIITNLVTMTLDSVPALQAQYGPLFIAVDLLSLVPFTIPYGL